MNPPSDQLRADAVAHVLNIRTACLEMADLIELVENFGAGATILTHELRFISGKIDSVVVMAVTLAGAVEKKP